jgi:hypothetical protein
VQIDEQRADLTLADRRVLSAVSKWHDLGLDLATVALGPS